MSARHRFFNNQQQITFKLKPSPLCLMQKGLIYMQTWQQQWAYNKYWLMARSQQDYNTVRRLARDNHWTADKQQIFEQILTRAATRQPTHQTLRTAYEHIWGYFKKRCTPQEKQIYRDTLQQLTPENDLLGPFLKKLAFKYQVSYLQQSRIIQELAD